MRGSRFNQAKAVRRAARATRKAARFAAAAQRKEDARALEIFQRLAESRAYAFLDEEDRPPNALIRPQDATRVLKETPQPQRALLIVNSKSGPDGSSLLKAREITETLAAWGIAVDARIKLRKSLARKEARAAAKQGYRLVIAAGGDGTVAAVARGLIGTDATLGIIPLGTYNNNATSLGIPTSIPEACALIAKGTHRLIDVGEVRATVGKKLRKPVPFFEVGAVGLAAAMAPVGQHVEKGRWEEARQLLPAALGIAPTYTEIRLDKHGPPRRTRTLLVVVANGPRAGAGLDLAPRARLDDGLLDVDVYEDLDQAALLTRFVAIRAGGQPMDDIADRSKARRVRVESVTPLPVVADSKVVGITPAKFRIRPGALKVIAGDGPGLTRPVPRALVAATSTIAHVVSEAQSDGREALPAPPDEQPPVVRALAEIVPTVGRIAESAEASRERVLPLAAAVVGGALVAPLMRALGRRLGF